MTRPSTKSEKLSTDSCNSQGENYDFVGRIFLKLNQEPQFIIREKLTSITFNSVAVIMGKAYTSLTKAYVFTGRYDQALETFNIAEKLRNGRL